MKRIYPHIVLCVVISIVIILFSCVFNTEVVQQEFCGKYDLPSDFSEALDYIDSKLEGYERREAYQQLIVDNPKSFYFDFNTIEEAPHYETSSDGKFRIYRFNAGMHEDPPILQFCNSKGRIVTAHLSTQPLYKEVDGEVVTEDDYKQGHFSAYARVLGQIEIEGVKTYIMFISDYVYEYMRSNDNQSNVLCEFVMGMQLTKTGYKYVNIFKYPSSGCIHITDEDEYYVKRVRSVYPASVQLQHGNAWYDKDKMVLHIPHSVENPRETFNIQKWDSTNQRFEPAKYFGYEYSPDIHKSLGNTYGLEIVMYFGDLLIRVDDDDPHNITYEHSYKYTAWGKGKTMANIPDLILYGGMLNKDEGTFHFINEGYEYIVPCAENKFNNKLIVKKNDKVILQKEIKVENEEE